MTRFVAGICVISFFAILALSEARQSPVLNNKDLNSFLVVLFVAACGLLASSPWWYKKLGFRSLGPYTAYFFVHMALVAAAMGFYFAFFYVGQMGPTYATGHEKLRCVVLKINTEKEGGNTYMWWDVRITCCQVNPPFEWWAIPFRRSTVDSHNWATPNSNVGSYSAAYSVGSEHDCWLPTEGEGPALFAVHTPSTATWAAFGILLSLTVIVSFVPCYGYRKIYEKRQRSSSSARDSVTVVKSQNFDTYASDEH